MPEKSTKMISRRKVPRAALCGFDLSATGDQTGVSQEAQFATTENDGPRKVSAVVLTGGELFHWYWGRTVFDLAAIKSRASQMPLLRDHDFGKVAGHADKAAVKDGAFVIEGVLHSTEHGQEVATLADEGLKWQMSVSLAAESTVELVEEGRTIEANGKKFKGPIAFWSKPIVQESSFTAVGVDGKTRAVVMSNDSDGECNVLGDLPETEKEISMSAETQGQEGAPKDMAEAPKENKIKPQAVELTAANLAEVHPAVAKDFAATEREAAVKEERERVVAIQAAAFDGQTELVNKLIADGATEVDALRQLNADAKTRNPHTLAEMEKGAPPPQGPSGKQALSANCRPQVAEAIKEYCDKEGVAKQWAPGGLREWCELRAAGERIELTDVEVEAIKAAEAEWLLKN